MKINEFRTMAQKAERAKLETIAGELYKRIPKGQKEELDEAILQILKGETPSAKKPAASVPFPELSAEIKTFLSYVDAGYYNQPNRIVPKQKRSKWRFEVMRFIKALDAVPGDEAASLYLELYKRLAYGCGYYIFPSEDPFRAIGIRQGDFYPRLAAKYFSDGFSDQKILDMLQAATSVNIDRESLYFEFETAFIRELKTRDMREKAYQIAKEEVYRLEALPQRRADDYETRRKVDEISSTILGLGISLYEEDDALVFFFQHYDNHCKEVQLYVALRTIDCFGGSQDLWCKVYDDAVARGVKPRESLVVKRKGVATHEVHRQI